MAEHTTTYPLEIRLFGHPDVRLDGEPLAPLRSRRGLWLLALLVLRHNRDVERCWLAGTLWADSDEQQALGNLRRTLTDLRQALGEQAEVIQSPTPHTLRFVLGENWADVIRFDAAVKAGNPSALEEAVALYRAMLMEGCAEEWVFTEREQRGQAYLDALETLAEHAVARQDWGQAAHYFRLITTHDALRESAQRGLMAALAQSGSFAAATQCFRDFRILLRREMNAEPDPETTALYKQLREKSRNSAAAPVSVPSPPSKPKSSDVTVFALPTPLTNFVGREREIQEVIECLEKARLVSLFGAGGIGKTRLAIRVAEEVTDEFPDGVCFVDLSALSNPDLILQSIASVLQIREQAETPLIETLCAALKSRSLLLILDNCEHLIQACSQIADTLLKQCPHLRLLTTTRQSLEVAGELVWRVPSLSLPDCEPQHCDEMTPDDLLTQSEAVRLFVERAASAMPTFALTPHSAPAVIQICRRLDGIALALELAAARVRILSVEQIAQRLQDRFRLLTDGNRTAPPRQQTLRAVVDWSYDLLSPQERLLFARLAVFSGGWTLEAAEAICTEKESREQGTGDRRQVNPNDPMTQRPNDLQLEDILDTLAHLADKSLIVVQGNQEGAARYRMMETIREYALGCLRASGEENALREQHRKFYVAMADQALYGLVGAEQAQWLERLEQEHDNIRAVLTWTTDAETRHSIAANISRFWLMRGYVTEGRAWLRSALEHPQEVDPSLRAHTLGSAALLASEQSDWATAETYFAECLAIRRQLGDPLRISRALNNCAMPLMYQQRYEEARPLFEESLAIKRDMTARGEINDPRGLAQSLGNLGMLACAQGRYGDAIQLHQECLEFSRAAEDKHSIAWAFSNLGEAAFRQGDVETALTLTASSIRIDHEQKNKRQLSDGLRRMGLIACRQGEWMRGVRLLEIAQSLLEAVEVPLFGKELQERNDVLAQAREQLGEEVYHAACHEGRAMTVDCAAAYALGEECEPTANV